MTLYGYMAYGRLSPHNLGGISLAGHVAWLLKAEDLPQQYRAVGQEAVADLRIVYAAMPPMTAPERYVNFTANNYNSALYGIILPRMWDRIVELNFGLINDTERRSSGAKLTPREELFVEVARDELLGAWARAAIVGDPISYFAHCVLHYWGLWRDSISSYYTVGQSPSVFYGPYRSFIWHEATAAENPYAKLYDDYREDWKLVNQDNLLASMQYPFMTIHPHLTDWYLASSLMMFSLILSFLYLIPVRCTGPIAAMITWALYVNAFTFGQALFQVSLPRFGEMIIPLFPLLAALILIAIQQLMRFNKLYVRSIKQEGHVLLLPMDPRRD
jgi:hypothetical protein